MKLAMVIGEEEERATKKSVFHTYERTCFPLTKFGVTWFCMTLKNMRLGHENRIHDKKDFVTRSLMERRE